MAYDKFTVLTSSAVPMPIENVDTDQIIPARFLKATERKGFGDNLFRDWRYNPDNTPKKDFILNNLFTAIEADPNTQIEVNLPEQTIRILGTKASHPGAGLEATGSFSITGYKKHNMMNGYDDIDFMQSLKNEIQIHAAKSIY